MEGSLNSSWGLSQLYKLAVNWKVKAKIADKERASTEKNKNASSRIRSARLKSSLWSGDVLMMH